ncbi:tyrosine-protein phosphatase [Pseudonocardia sp.]|uniref:tyrosine-protein phosphatase n=1 Tax=Pseudonocardia sp. TaxID=60912 RepID=UPI003D0DEB8C
MTLDTRWLKLEGLDNVRDVGGLPISGGGITRSGRLLRSAALHYVTDADVRHLIDVYGLSLVLDLRTAREINRDGPTPIARAGVRTVALTFVPEDGRPLPETGDDSDPLLRNYLGFLTDHPENVVEAARLIAAPDAGPALVHCQAGKDRTGVLVALVLDTIGVEREAVVEDYALSALEVEAMFRRWADALEYPMPDDLTPHMPRAEVIAALLARLDAEHGGAAGWLTANGLEPGAVGRLRSRLRG